MILGSMICYLDSNIIGRFISLGGTELTYECSLTGARALVHNSMVILFLAAVWVSTLEIYVYNFKSKLRFFFEFDVNTLHMQILRSSGTTHQGGVYGVQSTASRNGR
jgi:hypothetical protein